VNWYPCYRLIITFEAGGIKVLRLENRDGTIRTIMIKDIFEVKNEIREF